MSKFIKGNKLFPAFNLSILYAPVIFFALVVLFAYSVTSTEVKADNKVDSSIVRFEDEGLEGLILKSSNEDGHFTVTVERQGEEIKIYLPLKLNKDVQTEVEEKTGASHVTLTWNKQMRAFAAEVSLEDTSLPEHKRSNALMHKSFELSFKRDAVFVRNYYVEADSGGIVPLRGLDVMYLNLSSEQQRAFGNFVFN